MIECELLSNQFGEQKPKSAYGLCLREENLSFTLKLRVQFSAYLCVIDATLCDKVCQ
jgi:hypothetical protein